MNFYVNWLVTCEMFVLKISLAHLWLASTGEQDTCEWQCLTLARDDGKFQPYKSTEVALKVVVASLRLTTLSMYDSNNRLYMWYILGIIWYIKHKLFDRISLELMLVTLSHDTYTVNTLGKGTYKIHKNLKGWCDKNPIAILLNLWHPQNLHILKVCMYTVENGHIIPMEIRHS